MIETPSKILVIDDSPIIREMLVEVLTDDGYIVDIATNGETGVARALAGEYLVILCDVHMLQMNGLETVQQILKHRPLAKIIMTDSYPDRLAQQAHEVGAICCLQKPFDLHELRRIIGGLKQERVVPLGR